MKPGLYTLTEQEYFKLARARWSMVKSVLDCPAAYRHAVQHVQSSSKPKDLGLLVHSMVLEPEKVDDLYYRAEKVDRRTKIGKESWKIQQEAAGERELIEASVYDKAMDLSGRLRVVMDSTFGAWRKGRSRVEVAIVGDMYGIPAKCRIDLILDGRIWDIKTTRDLRPRAFMGSCVKFGYYGQLATYQRMLSQHEPDAEVGGIIAVQTSGAPIAHVLRFNDQAKAFGEEMSSKAWKTLLECRESSCWPGYDYDGEIGIPGWCLDDEA